MTLKATIVRQFGKPSGLIGRLAGHIMARRSSNRIRNRQTVTLMNLSPYSRVLEIGCGPGLALAQCAEIVSEGRIVGLDHSAVMIDQAQGRLLSAGYGQSVELMTGGVERLDDWTGAFDRVYSLNVIQFIADRPEFYRRVFSALDRGGMCFTTYQPRLDNDDPKGASRMADEVSRVMRDTGFQKITWSGIEAGPTPTICVIGEKQLGME